MANKYINDEPEEGTPTLGVVYHIVRRREIEDATGLEPIGYVVGDDDDDESTVTRVPI